MLDVKKKNFLETLRSILNKKEQEDRDFTC